MRSKVRPAISVIVASLICASSSGTSVAADADAPATGTTAAAAPAGPCSAAAFRQFDFWAGQWEVSDAAGKPVGHNRITIEEKGCVLVERWKSVAGNTGLSVNFYDPLEQTWTQQWIAPGSLLRMSGRLQDGGAMVLEGQMQYLGTGKVTRLRGTWTVLPDGRLRQHFEESADEGGTWQEWFDGYYRRAPGS